MNATASDPISSARRRPANGSLYEIRFLGSRSAQAPLPLAQTRFKIGAAPQCDLATGETGERPLQALIINGPGGVLIKNFRPTALLNGKAFSEARLQPGDQLKFGEIEFELASAQQKPAAESAPMPPTSERVGEATAKALEEAAKQIQRLQAELSAARDEADVAKQQVVALEQAPAPQPQSETPSPDFAEIELLRREIEREREQLQREREEAETVLRAERDRLIAEASRLEEAKRAPVEAAANEAAAQWNEREEQVARREQQLQDAIAREQAELDSQRQQLDEQRARLAEEREQARLELAEERRRLEDSLAQSQTAAPSPTYDEPAPSSDELKSWSQESIDSEAAPADEADLPHEDSADDIFARMRASGLFRETDDAAAAEEDSSFESRSYDEPAYDESSYDSASYDESDDRYDSAEVAEPEEEESKPLLGDAAPVSFIDQYASAFSDEEEDEPVDRYASPQQSYDEYEDDSRVEESVDENGDESIEAYMARLMQRVQGGPANSEKPHPTPTKPAKSEEKKPAKPKPAPKPVDIEPQEVMDPSEFKPRSHAPEQSSKLAAMRDLANQSARSAIKTSTKKVRWAYAGARFGMALFFFAVGFVMFWMTSSWFHPLFFGALVTVIGGMVLCYQGAQMLAGNNPNALPRPRVSSEPKQTFEEEE